MEFAQWTLLLNGFKLDFPTMELISMRNLELDKICRICLAMKREMRPLFGEMVAEMLMEIAKIQIEQLDGWPDKICIQCIHQVSRCHAFKTRVEKSDTTLRQYIKGITVVVEEQHQQQQQQHEMQHRPPPHIAPQPPKIQQIQPIQEIHIQRADIPTMAEQPAPTMILTNAQLLNAGAQIINAGHLLTTAAGQQIIQAAPQYHATQIGQFIQGLPNTIQMIAHGAPHPAAQILQIQRTADDRCEIVVQPEMQEQQYYDENNMISVNPVQSMPVMVAAPTIHQHMASDSPAAGRTWPITHLIHQHQHQQHQQHHHQQPEPEEHLQQDQQEEEESEESHLKDGPDSECGDQDDSQIDNDDEMVEEELLEEIEGEVEAEQEQEQEQEEEFYITDCESDDEEKKLAEFMSQQTTCHEGRFTCNLCRKEFSQEKWLQTHMSSHSNWLKANCKKQPECEICHKSFRGPGMLRMHMKTHEKADKLPTCSICFREFKSKSILYRHRQTHFEKNFACTLCDKRFSSNYQLNIHVQRHKKPKEKEHKCQHCDKAFYNASDLKVHVNQHLGIKVIQIKKVSTTS